MAQDMSAVTLDWTGLDALGFSNSDVRIFDRAQTAVFQTLFSFAQPDAAAMKRHIDPFSRPAHRASTRSRASIGSRTRALRLIVHGVFPRSLRASEVNQVVRDNDGKTHLMTPLIHSLEVLFAEKNSIRAIRHLKVCMLILSIYKMLADEHPNDRVDCNDCVCQTVQFHQQNHNLNPSVDHSEIKKQCFGKHITPLQILLKHVHVKQRKCPSLDVSRLFDTMIELVCGEERSLSTLYITINKSKRKPSSADENWACPQCTLINDHDAARCAVCLGAKPQQSFRFLTEGQEPKLAAQYRCALMNECKSDAVEMGVERYSLKMNIHRLSIGHVSLLLEQGCTPMTIRIKDDATHTICDISNEQLVRGFESKFSALRMVKEKAADKFDDIYPLMVLHSEARSKLKRVLSVCELCQSTVMRNYFGLIGDFVYGGSFAEDNVYETKLRMWYCRQQLDDIGIQSGAFSPSSAKGIKNGEFFRYWLSKYCLTDSVFLEEDIEMKKDLRALCEQTSSLRPMLYQFENTDAEMYNSYYY